MDEQTALSQQIDVGTNLEAVRTARRERGQARPATEAAVQQSDEISEAARTLAMAGHQKLMDRAAEGVLPEGSTDDPSIQQDLDPARVDDTSDAEDAEDIAAEAEESAEAAAEADRDEPEEDQGYVDLVVHRLSDGTEIAMAEDAAEYVSGLERQLADQAAVPIPAEMQQALAQTQQMLAQLGHVTQALNQVQAPDIELLDETSEKFNPSVYRMQQARYDQAMQDRQQAAQQQAYLAQQFEGQQKQILAQKWPDYVDPQKGPQVRQAAQSMLMQDYGFTAEELSQARDHRFALLARDALELRNLKASLPKVQGKLKGKPRKVIRPGTPEEPGFRASQATQRANETARQTGKVDDIWTARQLRRQSHGGANNL